jgi:hypothetical protein
MKDFFDVFPDMKLSTRLFFGMFAVQVANVYFCLFAFQKGFIVSNSLTIIWVVCLIVAIFWFAANMVFRVIIHLDGKDLNPERMNPNFFLLFFIRSIITLTGSALMMRFALKWIALPEPVFIWLAIATLICFFESLKDKSTVRLMDEG